MKQTAVEYLFQLIDDFGIKKIDRMTILKMEKQQIIDAVNNQEDKTISKLAGIAKLNKGEQYYNETFKNNGKTF